jgi:hypothetical protein
VLHFPLRTLEQSRRKFGQKVAAIKAEPADIGLHARTAGRAIDDGRFEQWYSAYVVDDARLESGLAEGSLAVDVRLREELRRLAGAPSLSTSPPPTFVHPGQSGSLLEFTRSGLAETALYADEMEALDVGDTERRVLQRVDALEWRIAELERGVGTRVGQRLRRYTGSGRTG